MKRLKRNGEEFVWISRRRVFIREFEGFKFPGSQKRGGNEMAFLGLRFRAGNGYAKGHPKNS